ICFDIVGCFNNNDPFNNANNELPQSPDFINTHFLLYTSLDETIPEILNYTDDSTIKNSKINPSLPFRIIVHGFTNNRDSAWISPLRQELFKK
ncbi:unnamed protein product, partial [Didymodactylos carnosus]